MLNTSGITVNETNPQWKQITANTPYKQKMFIAAHLDGDIKLTGKFRASDYGYASVSKQNLYNPGEENEFLKNTFQEKFEQSIIDSILITSPADEEKPFETRFTFTDESHLQVSNDKIYISPVLFTTFLENDFKRETRISEINFGYTFDMDYTLLFEIPTTYQVEELPAPTHIYLPDRTFEFLLETVTEGKVIRYHYNVKSSKTLYTAEAYIVLRAFFESLEKSGLQQIVLKKI